MRNRDSKHGTVSILVIETTLSKIYDHGRAFLPAASRPGREDNRSRNEPGTQTVSEVLPCSEFRSQVY